MKKITLFTVEITDNNYLQHPVCQLCLKTWPRLIEAFKNNGYDAEIKIYKANDPDVIEFKNIYLKDKVFAEDQLNVLSDAFRIYILSKYPNHLWFDSDMYVHGDIKDLFTFIDRAYIKDPFCVMYNSDNTELFKKLFNWYIQHPVLGDVDASNSLNKDPEFIDQLLETTMIPLPFAIRHLYKLMRVQQKQKLFIVYNDNDVKYIIDNFKTLTEGYLFDNDSLLDHKFCFVLPNKSDRNDFKEKLINAGITTNLRKINFIYTHNDLDLIEFIENWHQTINKKVKE